MGEEQSSALVVVHVFDKSDLEKRNTKLMFDAMKVRPGEGKEGDMMIGQRNMVKPLTFSIGKTEDNGGEKWGMVQR